MLSEQWPRSAYLSRGLGELRRGAGVREKDPVGMYQLHQKIPGYSLRGLIRLCLIQNCSSGHTRVLEFDHDLDFVPLTSPFIYQVIDCVVVVYS